MAAKRGRTLASFGLFTPFYVDGASSAAVDTAGSAGTLAPVSTAVGPQTTTAQIIGDPILMARPGAAPLRAMEAAEDALQKRLRE